MSGLRVLMVHTHYRVRGGEDESFASEAALLRRYGHEVELYSRENRELESMATVQQAVTTVWNQDAYADVKASIRRFRPDLVHFQNTFPLLSPSVIAAAAAEGIPVAVSLRNYRLFCLNALMVRAGEPCRACLGRSPILGVVHGCYEGSRVRSGAIGAMLMLHRLRGTWSADVDVFIATSEYVRRTFIKHGIDPARIVTKPNVLVNDPGVGLGSSGDTLYVGRLTAEKGIRTLLSAWRLRPRRGKLLIAGDGPLAQEVRRVAEEDSSVRWLGRLSHADSLSLMREAKVVVVPSEWEEPFGRVVIEAMAAGTPVIAARVGGMTELVSHGHDGWLFDAGNASQLDEILGSVDREPAALEVRENARTTFVTRFSLDSSYRSLLSAYQIAVDVHRRR